jgi:transglutaminase-like putative cysteine protease
VAGHPNPSTEVVMTVAVDGYQPAPAGVTLPGEAPSSIRYYWRSQTFDFYTGRSWDASIGETTPLEPGPEIPPAGQLPRQDFQTVTQHVTRLLAGQAVLVTGELLSLDQPASVTWRSPDDFAGAVTSSNTYTAESRVPLVTVEALRQAGVDYPQEIRQYYLQLPDNLPARVRNLAFEISSREANPYDQATAIETYLRQFPYTLDVPAPPAGSDLADYFLFDLQQGYCDYYAGTMVVLARAAGIPARLVTGFSGGVYDEASGAFIVRGNNAHARVEVYFPGSGWFEFEPTANQPGLTRLHAPGARPETEPLPVVPLPKGPSALARFWRGLYIPPGWLAAAGIALLLGLLIPLEGWLLHLQKPEQAVDTIQQRLYRLGHRWELPRRGALTPGEFAGALAGCLDPYALTPRLAAMLASIRWDLDWQTALYVRNLYAGRPPSRTESHKAVQAWLVLQRRLWWLRLRFGRGHGESPR